MCKSPSVYVLRLAILGGGWVKPLEEDKEEQERASEGPLIRLSNGMGVGRALRGLL